MSDPDTVKCVRTFDPWEGSLYSTTGLFGIRIMILGEAHYGDPAKLRASTTIEMVRLLGQQQRHRFFTTTRSLVLDTRGWVPDKVRAAFWESVTYCNFIQSFAGEGPRIRPKPEMWSAAREPLLLSIRELKPQLLIVLGKDVQRNLPEIPDDLHMCGVPHPSGRGFRLDMWRPIVRSAIAKAGGQFPNAEPTVQAEPIIVG